MVTRYSGFSVLYMAYPHNMAKTCHDSSPIELNLVLDCKFTSFVMDIMAAGNQVSLLISIFKVQSTEIRKFLNLKGPRDSELSKVSQPMTKLKLYSLPVQTLKPSAHELINLLCQHQNLPVFHFVKPLSIHLYLHMNRLSIRAV